MQFTITIYIVITDGGLIEGTYLDKAVAKRRAVQISGDDANSVKARVVKQIVKGDINTNDIRTK